MSEFHVEVVRIGKVEKHPNADSLSITTIHDAYPVIFKTGEFHEGQLAVYIPVDSLVPDRLEWGWLAPAGAALRDKDRRIKAKRLRGVFSTGLLHPAPPGFKEGDDIRSVLGIEKYDPDAGNEIVASKPQRRVAQRRKGFLGLLRWTWQSVWFYFFPKAHFTKTVSAPKLKFLPGVYDIEPFRKFGKSWFEHGEELVVTEKIHGQNASFVHDGKQLHIKSRTRWRKNDPSEAQNTWAKVAAKYGLAEKLAAHPGIILYGETYGNNADMPYGVKRADEGDNFLAFDVYDSNKGRWFDYLEFDRFCRDIGVPTAPELAALTWNDEAYDILVPLAEGKTTLSDKHTREGFVIKPIFERSVNGGQRVILKMAGEGYLTRKTA